MHQGSCGIKHWTDDTLQGAPCSNNAFLTYNWRGHEECCAEAVLFDLLIVFGARYRGAVDGKSEGERGWIGAAGPNPTEKMPLANRLFAMSLSRPANAGREVVTSLAQGAQLDMYSVSSMPMA